MSEKRLDAKNRWRNVVVAFRMSPEEAQELNVKVSLSGPVSYTHLRAHET